MAAARGGVVVVVVALSLAAATRLSSAFVVVVPALDRRGGVEHHPVVEDPRRLRAPPPPLRAEVSSATSVRVEDRDVPEAHRGLHDTLYGDGEDHGSDQAASDAPNSVDQRLDGRVVYELGAWAAEHSRKIAGIYVVRDADGRPRFVGTSRDVAVRTQTCVNVARVVSLTRSIETTSASPCVQAAARAHRSKLGADIASTIRVVEKSGLARRSELEAMRDKVLAALLPEVPDGNTDELSHLWAATTRDALVGDEEDAAAAQSSEDELLRGRRADYASKKRKLRAAMALSSGDDDAARGADGLRRAVEDDDWSAVVSDQHRETRQPSDDAASSSGSARSEPPVVVSPFARGLDESTAASVLGGVATAFTKDAVDGVLDAVRPMLAADGGDVRVVSVDPADKSVVLSLVGACGTCPSATTTMENGIETALRRAWPDLGPVSRAQDHTRNLNVASADALLDPIRAAYTALGARATVLHANLLGPGIVELEYAGPENVRYGIELTLLSSPMISEVRWVAAADGDAGGVSGASSATAATRTGG